MTPAPALDCAMCHRRIGKTRTHLMIGGSGDPSAERMICLHCANHNARTLHAKFYPDCPDHWHDLFDHPASFATRAAAANLLGLWP